MVKKVLKVVDPKILKTKVEGSDVSLRRLVVTELSNIYKIPKKEYSKKTNIELLHELETLRNSKVDCMIPWNKFVQDNIYRVQDKFPRTEWFSELAKLWKAYKTDLPMVTEDQAEKLDNKKKEIKKPVKKGSYAEFVKLNYSKVTDKPPKERMKELGKLWKARNDLPKPVIEMKIPEVEVMVKKPRGRPKKPVIDNTQPVEKKPRGRPKKSVSEPIPLQSVPIVENQPVNQPVNPKKSKGRPKKSVPEPEMKIPENPEPVPKKTREPKKKVPKFNEEEKKILLKLHQIMTDIAKKGLDEDLTEEDIKNYEINRIEYARMTNIDVETLQQRIERLRRVEAEREQHMKKSDIVFQYQKCKELLKRENITSIKDYRAWALKNHPDKGGDPEVFKIISECRKFINQDDKSLQNKNQSKTQSFLQDNSQSILDDMYMIAKKGLRVPLTQEDLKNFDLYTQEFIRLSNKQPPTLADLTKKAEEEYNASLQSMTSRTQQEYETQKSQQQKMDDEKQQYENSGDTSPEENYEYNEENYEKWKEKRKREPELSFEAEYRQALAIIDLGKKQPLSPREVLEYQFLRRDCNEYINFYNLDKKRNNFLGKIFKPLPTIIESLKRKSTKSQPISLLDTKPKRKKKELI